MSVDFPVTASAYQPSIKGTSSNLFISKFPLAASQALSVSSATPTAGGNSGTVTLRIFGTGFHAGATAQLNCPSPIMGANMMVGPGGRVIDATFNLVGVPPGTCDIVVTNLDGASVTLAGAFTVQQGGAPNIQVYLTGLERRKVPPEVQLGPADVLVAVTVSNTGNIDSTGTLISLPVDSPFTPTSATPTSLDDAQTLQTTSEVQWLQPVPAGTSQIVMATTSSPTQSTSPVSVQACTDDKVNAYACCFSTKVANTFAPTCGNMSYQLQTAATTVCSIDCALEADPKVCGNALSALYKLMGLCRGGKVAEEAYKTACREQGCPPSGSQLSLALGSQAPITTGCTTTTTTLPIVIPTDPNDLVGPPGVGGQRWIAGVQALTYVISFSNIPTAPVPAQQVIVTLPLGSNVNLSSLSLLGITIPNGANNVQASVPAGAFNPSVGVNEFTTNIDLRPTQSLLVNVDALLNPATQTLTWTLTSIDPATGQPPVNPLIGFLPAGAEANVSYSVTSKPSLATGAQIAAQASIVFVGNSPMNTPVWVNTLDNNAPGSRVAALPATESCSNFKVQWSGSDLGAGTQSYTVYASDNGAGFVPWLTNTSSTSSVVQGQVGHSYGFYSIARDLVGNVEAAKTSAEATTSVASGNACGPPSLSGAAGVVSYVNNALSLNLQFANIGPSDALNTLVKTLTFRTLAGTGSVTLASPQLPLTFGTISVDNTITIPVTLNVPATVKKFSMTEGGTMQDGSGKTYSFSLGQNVVPK